jgi:protein-arginine kinase activator protein McsA
MTENDESYIDNHINEIFKDFKDNFMLLLINYNSKRDSYNNIKIKVLTDKMNEYANDELYEEAALIRDKIKSLTIANINKI